MRLAAALGFLLALCAGAATHPRAAARRKAPEAPKFDPAAVNDPATGEPLGPGHNGSAVLRAEILLDRVHFSPGQIDGRWGSNLEQAVRAFQTAHAINASGTVDAPTWQALNAAQSPAPAPALIDYSIAPQDETGPFAKIPPELLDQAKLQFLGYETPLEELAERFHSSPGLLKALNAGKDFGKTGETITVPGVQRIPLDASRVAHVVVRRDCNCVEAVDSQGGVLAHYPATMGSTHDPLPIGDFTLKKPDFNPVFYYDPSLLWNEPQDNPKAKIAAGPNNPVGLCWIGLDKKHYGIHGTPDPSLIGKSLSHGCIRLTNWDVLDLAGLVKAGMEADLRQG
jgi:lipoprotein-anchoring transpeptidase ErfK/SrfK